jgi:membrane-associated protein
MSALVNFLILCLHRYNIWFLGILIILQGVGVPTFPSMFVIALGAFSFAGDVNPIYIFFQVWMLVSVGDAISYWIWRRFEEFLFGKFKGLNKYFAPKVEKTKIFLEKRGKWAIFISRFIISAMAPVLNAVAGITKYKFKTFIIVAAIGDIFWAGMYVLIGYWFGDSWEEAATLVSGFSKVITLVAIFIMLLYFSRKWILNKKGKS